MTIENMQLLSIDDNQTNLLIIESYTKSLHIQTYSYLCPEKALESCKEKEYDLIIIDYMMPKMDGLEFIQKFRKTNMDTPIIMLTAVNEDMELQINALNYGANDFLHKPINPASFKARVTNMLNLRKSQLLLKDKALLLQEEVNTATKTLKEREHETLEVLGRCAMTKDADTGAHVDRVGNYCKILAKLAGLDEIQQDIIYHSAPLHDIGKIGITDQILRKPGKLTWDEFEEMKEHAKRGYKILKNSKSIYLKQGGIIAHTHHERYDGTGYPQGLRGEEIPIFGRITAIVDVFDSLTSVRSYKEAWSFEAACDLLVEEKNKHFDPVLVDLFMNNIHEFKKIFKNENN